jgi:hypothetical protein
MEENTQNSMIRQPHRILRASIEDNNNNNNNLKKCEQ